MWLVPGPRNSWTALCLGEIHPLRARICSGRSLESPESLLRELGRTRALHPAHEVRIWNSVDLTQACVLVKGGFPPDKGKLRNLLTRVGFLVSLSLRVLAVDASLDSASAIRTRHAAMCRSTSSRAALHYGTAQCTSVLHSDSFSPASRYIYIYIYI